MEAGKFLKKLRGWRKVAQMLNERPEVLLAVTLVVLEAYRAGEAKQVNRFTSTREELHALLLKSGNTDYVLQTSAQQTQNADNAL